MRAFRERPLIVLLAVLCLAGCEHADPLDPGRLEPTLSSIQANVFDLNCALSGCHAGSSPQQGLNLSRGQARANIVGVRSNQRPNLLRVEPGNPDGSYLFQKITGAAGILGERMPRGRPPLSAEQIDAIRQWIADGALDN